MKKKFLTFLFAICLIIPCAFIMSACGKVTLNSLEFEYGDETGSEIVVEYDYGETLEVFNNIKLFAKYSDGSKKEIQATEATKKFYHIPYGETDKSEVTTIPQTNADCGEWILEITYEEKTATAKAIVNPIECSGLLTTKLYIDGQIVDSNYIDYQEPYCWTDTTHEIKVFDGDEDKSDLIISSYIITEEKYNEIVGEENNTANLSNHDFVFSIVGPDDYARSVVGLDVGKYYIFSDLWPDGNYTNSLSKFAPLTITAKEVEWNSEDYIISATYNYGETGIFGKIKASDMQLSYYPKDFLNNWSPIIFEGEKVEFQIFGELGHFEFYTLDTLLDSTANGTKIPVKFVFDTPNFRFSSSLQADVEINRGRISAPFYSSSNMASGFEYQNEFNGTTWVPKEHTVEIDNDVNNEGNSQYYRLRQAQSYGKTNSLAGTYAREYELIDPINYYWSYDYNEITEDTFEDNENMEYVTIEGNPIIRIKWTIYRSETIDSEGDFYGGLLSVYRPNGVLIESLGFTNENTLSFTPIEGYAYITFAWPEFYYPESLDKLQEEVELKVYTINDDTTRTDVTESVLGSPSLYLQRNSDDPEHEDNYIPNWRIDLKAFANQKCVITLKINYNRQIEYSTEAQECIVNWNKVNLADDSLSNPIFYENYSSRWNYMVENGDKLSDVLEFLTDYENYFTCEFWANEEEPQNEELLQDEDKIDFDTYTITLGDSSDVYITIKMTPKEGYENVLIGGYFTIWLRNW